MPFHHYWACLLTVFFQFYLQNTQGVRQVSLSDTALLATHVVQHLPENHPEQDLAVELFEALQALISYDSNE